MHRTTDNLMQVVGFTEFGGPEVLGTYYRPIPRPGIGEIVVAVAAATVNPTDTLLRSGAQRERMGSMVPPYIPGMEFAGIVHEAGDGVELAVGTRVMGIVSPHRAGAGAQAEYVRLPTESATILPPGVSLLAAATVPMNGLTALMAVESLGLEPGSTVLVTGAAGAVGGYCIQIASQAGLRVVAEGRAADLPLLRSLGADHIVERGADLSATVRDLAPAGVAGLIDAGLVGEAAAALVADLGVVADLRGTPSPDNNPRVTRRVIRVTDRASDTSALAELANWVVQGRLTPRVARRLALRDAAKAHQLLEQGGLRGRLVLQTPAGGGLEPHRE